MASSRSNCDMCFGSFAAEGAERPGDPHDGAGSPVHGGVTVNESKCLVQPAAWKRKTSKEYLKSSLKVDLGQAELGLNASKFANNHKGLAPGNCQNGSVKAAEHRERWGRCREEGHDN